MAWGFGTGPGGSTGRLVVTTSPPSVGATLPPPSVGATLPPPLVGATLLPTVGVSIPAGLPASSQLSAVSQGSRTTARRTPAARRWNRVIGYLVYEVSSGVSRDVLDERDIFAWVSVEWRNGDTFAA
ncbi:hypothetical protein AB0F52_38425 [Amycolatopsis sp. NPDC024027]|uniref:hypothetical protein n=1 Tax=Amycolatopsis sp. NPDC024027 TaxID=3154327 RepID=UPI0033FB1CA2